jgi:hypothetical protein
MLSGLVAAGVALAGVLLSRIVRIRAAQWIAAGAASYGALAFASAALSGVTVPEALAGAGGPHGLPRAFHGAFVGACVVLPLGWIVSILRAGIPRLREGSPRRAAYQAVALSLSVAIVVSSLPSSRAQTRSSTPAPNVVELDNGLRAIEDADRTAPRDRWDHQFVVDTIGRDPKKLLDWVQDHTRWVPYRGVLRGPVGVLIDRQGNSLDRALLAVALLGDAGTPARLAHCELTPEQAESLLNRATPPVERMTPGDRSATPPHPNPADITPEIRGIAARYHLDAGSIERTIATAESVLSGLQRDLDQRVERQTKRLLAAIPPPDDDGEWSRRHIGALAAARDHWWVQWNDGARWVDRDFDGEVLDPAALGAAPQTATVAELAPDLYDQVVVRVVAEHWSGRDPVERTVLEHPIRVADVPGHDIVLQFWPGAWPTQIAHDMNGPLGFKSASLEQRDWVAALAIDGRARAQGIVSAATPIAAAANPFAGIASAFAAQKGMASSASASDRLTAVWIEYETRVPGESPETIRREVFDVVGAAARSARQQPVFPLDEARRLRRSAALMMRTEILPVGFRIAPEFAAHLAVHATVSGSDLLRAVAQSPLALDETQLTDRLKAVTPPPGPLLALGLARLGFAPAGDHLFIGRPNILTIHRSVVVETDGVSVMSAFDIVTNAVDVDLVAHDGFARRVRQGILDTNAEALLMADTRSMNTADAYEAVPRWRVIGAHDGASTVSLAPDAEAMMRGDADAGSIVVAPDRPLPAAARAAAGWWRVDPASGTTIGRAGNGWGMGPEYGSLLQTAATAVGSFFFEYGLCQTLPQGLNLLRLFNQQYAGGWAPSWASAAKAKDPTEVLAENHRMCLISAIAAGFVATLPILMMTIKVRNMRRAAALAEEAAALEAEGLRLEQQEKALLELPDVGEPRVTAWSDAPPGMPNGSAEIPPGAGKELTKFIEKQHALEAATTYMESCRQQLNGSLGRYMEYQRGRLLDPKYDQSFEAILREEAERDFAKYSSSVSDVRGIASDGRAPAGPRPAPPPPPPIGNNNPTQPDLSSVVGSAGTNNALKGGG